MDKVILVNKNNRKIGEMEKLEAHQKGLLHRAFSIFVFNKDNELLLQQRNPKKYHSGGLWTNTVCSHPAPGETYNVAVHRRLKEEMGFDCTLVKLGCFIYRAAFPNGLIENEYDCIFAGKYDGVIEPNSEEISDHCWLNLEEISENIQDNPEKYTFWFKKILSDKETLHLLQNYLRN
ncbi:MAG: Isopentenyl-diphosphate Delta-isomerase [bacterium ADurb.Bin212]|nr:MAG: Isopentenyl-diphosphate Delta-isomerase [bacterium ADurb.Bin212]